MHIVFRAAFIISAVLFSSVFILAADKKEDLTAASYIVIEADTGMMIDGIDTDRRLDIGYLSKLMSILLIAEDIDSGKYTFNDILTASDSVTDTKGSVIWLQSGDALTVDELLKSVIVGNANDALTVLAENSSGSIGDFVNDMNAKAFDLGLRDTFFKTPYGYSDDASYSTAHDVAVICSELAKHSFLQRYFTIWRDFVKNGQVELVSENDLARNYDKHIGFKACHSDKSGYCIAEGGRKGDGTAFIVVILGADTADNTFKSAKKLIKQACYNYKVSDTMFPEEMLKPVLVRSGTESAVEICIKEQGRTVVPREQTELRTKVVIPEFLTAPVRADQPVGTAAFYNGDKLVFEADIITKSAVPRLDFTYVLEKLLVKLIEK